jgi:hypothetical protein
MSAPFSQARQVVVQPVSTVGNDLNTNVLSAPQAGTLTAVGYATVTAITGAATNTRSVTLVNKGAAGTGTTSMATLQFDSGVNTVANVPKVITLTTTAADRVVAAGDVLQFQSTHVGTGIADPGGLLLITIAANYA